MIKIVMLRHDEKIPFWRSFMCDADVVFQVDGDWHVNIQKNKINGHRGSVHKSVLVEMLEEDEDGN